MFLGVGNVYRDRVVLGILIVEGAVVPGAVVLHFLDRARVLGLNRGHWH
jgi:hypothetical protein